MEDIEAAKSTLTLKDESTTPAGLYTPTPQEVEMWGWLESAANESERVREDEAEFSKFDSALNIFYGKHWPKTMPSYRPPIVANELRTLILSEASDLSESQLRIYVSRNKNTQGRDAKAERAFRAVWARNFVDLELLYACMWSLIVGTGFIDVQWDSAAANGMGDVVVEHRDPRTVLPDPDAVNDIKWNMVIKETVMDLYDVRRLFPIKGMYVKPEDRYSAKERAGSFSPEGPRTSYYSGPLYSSSIFQTSTLGFKKSRARILDAVFRDPAMESVVEEELDSEGTPRLDENGNKILVSREKALYPFARRVVGCNGVILWDGPYNYRDFGLLRVILEPALGRFWSNGFVQQTEQLQLAANKMLSAQVENAIRLNNGLVVAIGNTGLDWESFASIPAQVLQINANSEVKIVYPPPMPPDMVQAPERMLALQRRLLGFSEPRTGQAGRGNISADLTETEIAQSQSTTRLRARMLYNVVQRLAEMIFARMAMGYTTPRTIPAVEGQSYEPVNWEPLEKPEEYSVYVDPASFAVMSKTMLKRLGSMLFRMQAIDRKSLLETIEWPNWESVAGRMDKAAAAAAMMKAQSKKK